MPSSPKISTSLNPVRIRALVRRAAEKRRNLFGQLDMFRVFDADGDGIPHLYIDRLGPIAVARVHQQRAESKLASIVRAAGDAIAEAARVDTVYLRRHFKQAKNSADAGSERIFGRPRTELILEEHTIKFAIRPDAHLNAGIFLDTRDVRQWLLGHASGLRVLNTFCYTGSLGLAAWCGGAREVVQVDSSQMALDWARGNLDLNSGRGSGEMRFIREDCLEFMAREERRLKKGQDPYDCIVLDPPCFGTADGGSFSLRRNLADLVNVSLALLGTGGYLIMLVNARDLTQEQLSKFLSDKAREAGREIVELRKIRSPREDFTATSRQSIAMKGMLARLD